MSASAFLFLCALGVLCAVNISRGQQNAGEVRTTEGTIIGTKPNNYYYFLGVPYAKAPLDKLRFMPPQQPDSYTTLDARMSKICPQVDPFENMGITGSEDCLTLDIFVSTVPQPGSTPQLFPVLVYLPGGKFRYGGSSTFRPENILGSNPRCVIVVVNYRLGVLGFLSTEDDIVPGNMGLLDQSMALQWIKNNIKNFGGDPQKVMLFGHDSGAASVGLHLVSKKSQGLFQRAAMFGGAIENPWAFRRQQARRHAETFASRLNCPTGNSRDMVECLRQKNERELIEQQNTFTNISFLPLVDKNFTQDPFLEDKPMDLIRRKQDINRVPMIFSMTENEGSIDFYNRLDEAMRESLPRSAMTLYLRQYLFPKTVFGDWSNPEEDRAMENIIKGVHYLYFRELQSTDWAKTKPNWTEMISDYYYRGGIVNMARLWAQNIDPNTYLYSLEYKSHMSYGKLVPKNHDYGVAHMDDVFYYFNTTYRFQDSQQDTHFDQIKRNLITMLLEMADSGKISNNNIVFQNNPNVLPNTYTCIALETNQNQIKYVPSLLDNIDSRMDFWTYFIPDLLNNTDIYEHVPMVHAKYASATWGLVSMVVILCILCTALVSVIIVTRRQSKFMKVPTKSTENIEIKQRV